MQQKSQKWNEKFSTSQTVRVYNSFSIVMIFLRLWNNNTKIHHTYTHIHSHRPLRLYILLVNMYRRTNRQNHQSLNRGTFVEVIGGGQWYFTSLLLLLLLLSSVKLRAFKYYCNATLVFSHTRTFNTIWKSINKGWVPVLISLNSVASQRIKYHNISLPCIKTISRILLLSTHKSKNKMTNDLKVLVLGGKYFFFLNIPKNIFSQLFKKSLNFQPYAECFFIVANSCENRSVRSLKGQERKSKGRR